MNTKKRVTAAMAAMLAAGVISAPAIATAEPVNPLGEITGQLNNLVPKVGDLTKARPQAQAPSTSTGAITDNASTSKGFTTAIASTLVDGKGVNPDDASKAATSIMSLVKLADAVDSGDLTTAKDSGTTCGTALSAAGAGTAATGGIAAPAALAALPPCAQTAGASMKIAGSVIKMYQEDPNLPQAVEFAALIDPDTEVGKKIISKLPKEAQTPEVKQAMKITSTLGQNLAKIKFGETLVQVGDGTTRIGGGDASGGVQVATATLTLGVKVLAAGVGSVTGTTPDTGLLDFGALSQKTASQSTSGTGTMSSGGIANVKKIAGIMDSPDSNLQDKNGKNKPAVNTKTTSTPDAVLTK